MLALLFLIPAQAAAEPPAPPPGANARPAGVSALPERPRGFERGVGLEFGSMSLQSAGFIPAAWVVGATARAHWPSGVEGALGMRVLFAPGLPSRARAEGYLSVAIAPEFGPWRPAVGLELGVSGVDHLEVSQRASAPGSDRRVRTEFSPFYAAVNADILRFRVGPVGFGAGRLQFGTEILRPGRVLRVMATIAYAEVWF